MIAVFIVVPAKLGLVRKQNAFNGWIGGNKLPHFYSVE